MWSCFGVAKYMLSPVKKRPIYLPGRHPGTSVDTSAAYEQLVEDYQRTNTPVEVDFRAMVSWLRMGDQLTHHLHPYPAKLLPHIAHFFLRADTIKREGASVLDPFCGSGTVALEGSVAGYRSLVADANPLSIALTRVKTEPYSTDALTEATYQTVARARRFRSAPEVDVVNGHLWYSAPTKKTLERLLRAIREESDRTVLDFLEVCFSAVARKLSYADPAVSVPVRLRPKERLSSAANQKILARLEWLAGADPIEEFSRHALQCVQRIDDTNKSHPHRKGARIVGRDARDLRVNGRRLPSESVPLIITSPPYGSAQKYIRATSLSLNWLQLAGPEELAALESRSIGREHVAAFREAQKVHSPLPQEYSRVIELVRMKNEIRAEITALYLSEMAESVAEMSRVLKPRGRAIIVIGNNQVAGHTLRNDDFLIQAFAKNGINLETYLIDHIKSRGLMTKRNRTASIISREAVLVFRKG